MQRFFAIGFGLVVGLAAPLYAQAPEQNFYNQPVPQAPGSSDYELANPAGATIFTPNTPSRILGGTPPPLPTDPYNNNVTWDPNNVNNGSPTSTGNHTSAAAPP